MLFGYPSAISHIALRAERRGVRLDDLGVKVVFCTSERLYDHQRETIRRLLGCPVANGYGGRKLRLYSTKIGLLVAAGRAKEAQAVVAEARRRRGSLPGASSAGS